MHVQLRRGLLSHHAHIQTAVFDAAVVLLLNIWTAKHGGISLDTDKELADVQKCVDILRSFERRWLVAGRLCDIIIELIVVGDFRSPPSARSLKRGRNEEESPSEIHPRISTNFCDQRVTPSPLQAELQHQSTQEGEQASALFSPTDGLGQFPAPDIRHGVPLSSDQELLDLVDGFSADANDSWSALRPSPANSTHDTPSNYLPAEFFTAPLPPLTDSAEHRLPSQPQDGFDMQYDTTVWSNTPSLYSWADWGTYIANFDELTHSADARQ